MEAVFFSETLVAFYKFTRRNSPRVFNFRLLSIQGDSGGKVDIVGGDFIGHYEKKVLFESTDTKTL
jgi:hypothetical protein